MKKGNDGKLVKLNQANILSVSIRVLVTVVLAVGIFFIRNTSGSDPSVFAQILTVIMALGGLVCIGQLIYWGLKWVAQERVSELGLHIVRFGVILTAIVLSIFMMMSRDYDKQYLESVENELCQQALAGRMYIQKGIGDDLGSDQDYYDSLYAHLRQMLEENSVNSNRHVCLYLVNRKTADFSESLFFSPIKDSNIVAASTGAVRPMANAEYIDRVMGEGNVLYRTYVTDEGGKYSAACTPVFTRKGMPVGVLEICEKKSSSVVPLQFASTDFLLTVATIIMLFAFLFYGVMQFMDIIMRPHNVDPSKKILICGREAARPVLFFVAMTTALPVIMLMSSDSFCGLVRAGFLPDSLSAGLPLIVYIIGVFIGSVVVRKEGGKLTEMPSNLGLAVAFLCDIGMIVLMDWSGAVEKGWNNPAVILALLAISGCGRGISYRTIAKYQGQSDALFGNDKYAYLSSCLGAVTGIALGAVLADYAGELTVKIVLAVLALFTVILSIWLLQDLEKTVETEDTKVRKELRSYAGVIVGLIPVGAACCYVWKYVTTYLKDSGYAISSLAFCVALPVVAFCFGNRLRVKTDGAQSNALLISGILAGLAFVPMMFEKWRTEPMALLSVILTALSVIFAASAVYSFMKKKEIGRAALILAPLAILGIIVFAILSGSDSWVWRLVFVIISALAAAGAMLSNAPKRVIVKEGLVLVEDIPETSAARPEKPERKEKKIKPEKTPKPIKAPKEEKIDNTIDSGDLPEAQEAFYLPPVAHIEAGAAPDDAEYEDVSIDDLLAQTESADPSFDDAQ